jgi:hypothetical protein
LLAKAIGFFTYFSHMTIAVSAVINRSRWLFGAVTVMCACIIAVGCLIGFNSVGDLNVVERIAIAAICVATAVAVFWRAAVVAKAAIIYVSGTGQFIAYFDVVELLTDFAFAT